MSCIKNQDKGDYLWSRINAIITDRLKAIIIEMHYKCGRKEFQHLGIKVSITEKAGLLYEGICIHTQTYTICTLSFFI